MNPQQTMKMREVREWATFVLSFLTVAAIPVGVLILHDMKLEIKQDMSREFVNRETYAQDKERMAADRAQEIQTIGIIQGKIESMQLEQIHEADTLALIKDQLPTRRTP